VSFGVPSTYSAHRLQFYSEFQAVASGVDEDTWTLAIRQTIIQ
jgi:hypothetical protein